MRSCFVLVACVASLCACSSKPKVDIEPYPGASTLPAGPNIEAAEGTLYKVRQGTADGQGKVAEFYRPRLTALGWKEQDRGIAGLVFTDENVATDGTFDFNYHGLKPVDPSKPGGTLAIQESDSRVEIRLFRYLPKKK